MNGSFVYFFISTLPLFFLFVYMGVCFQHTAIKAIILIKSHHNIDIWDYFSNQQRFVYVCVCVFTGVLKTVVRMQVPHLSPSSNQTVCTNFSNTGLENKHRKCRIFQNERL